MMKHDTTRRKFLKILSVISASPAILYHGSFSKKQTIPRLGYLKPGDLPVKYPEKYYFTLNTATVKMLGIQFSKELLTEASKIIE